MFLVYLLEYSLHADNNQYIKCSGLTCLSTCAHFALTVAMFIYIHQVTFTFTMITLGTGLGVREEWTGFQCCQLGYSLADGHVNGHHHNIGPLTVECQMFKPLFWGDLESNSGKCVFDILAGKCSCGTRDWVLLERNTVVLFCCLTTSEVQSVNPSHSKVGDKPEGWGTILFN